MKTNSTFPSLWQSILVLVVAIVLVAVISFIFSLIGQLSGLVALKDLNIIIIFGNGFGLGLVIWYALKKNPDLITKIQRGHIDVQISIALVLAGLGVSILLSEIDNIFRSLIRIPDFLVNYLSSIIYGESFYSTFIALVIVAPITEELLFRGVILSGLSSKYGSRKAVILTSLLFGLFHLNPVQIIGAIFVGLVLGWMKLKFDSIVVPIVFHGIYNALPLIFGRILKIDIQGYSTLDMNPVLQPAWFDALGILFTIIGLFLLHRLSKRKKHASESVT